MSTLPHAIRTVKTPIIPPDDDELAAERCHRALARLRQQTEQIETLTDPDLLEDADGALADLLFEVRYPRRRAVTPGPRDSGIVPVALAERIASGAWRQEL